MDSDRVSCMRKLNIHISWIRRKFTSFGKGLITDCYANFYPGVKYLYFLSSRESDWILKDKLNLNLLDFKYDPDLNE